MHPILRFLITAAALWCIGLYVPGFHINGLVDALIAAIIFGLVNMIIGQRADEANSRVVKAADDMMSQTNELVR